MAAARAGLQQHLGAVLQSGGVLDWLEALVAADYPWRGAAGGAEELERCAVEDCNVRSVSQAVRVSPRFGFLGGADAPHNPEASQGAPIRNWHGVPVQSTNLACAH